MTDADTTNEYIKNLITNKDIFMITRTGWGAEPVISYGIVYNKPYFLSVHPRNILEYNAGIYKQNPENLSKWAYLYYNAIKNSTCCFVWKNENVSSFIKKAQIMLTLGVNNMSAEYLDPLVAVESGKKPWTQSLCGKKLLIISPFTDSIKYQNDKGYNLISGDNRLFHPDQKYIYYKTFNTLGGNFVHSNWSETFMKMIQDISILDFDIALVSCGGYGLPICDFIYSKMKKSSIYVGGVLPLLFGVTCERYKEPKFLWRARKYNPGMIKPNADEQVEMKSFRELYSYGKNNEVENKCYW